MNESQRSRAHRILLLGEGNYSFSLALCMRLASLNTPVHLLCTSFDTEDELYRKYPESRRTIFLLQNNQKQWPSIRVSVVFGFDASRSYIQQFRAKGVAPLPLYADNEDFNTMGNSSSTCNRICKCLSSQRKSGNSFGYSFDSILFNFPHIGAEDAQLHGCLVSHIMHSLQETFCGCGDCCNGASDASAGRTQSQVPDSQFECPEQPLFFLCLADAQWQRWNIPAAAARTGLSLVSTSRFAVEDWPGYEIKRHINGKGFHSRVQACSYFCYGLTTTAAASAGDTLAAGKAIAEPHLLRELIEGSGVPLLAPAIAGSAVRAADPTPAVGAPQAKRRRVRASTEGMWRACDAEAAEEGAAGDQGCRFECLQCFKRFTQEQAVMAHAYNVHVLGQSPASSGRGSVDDGGEAESDAGLRSVETRCSACERSFSSVQAMEAHRTSVHGKFPVLKPSWAAATAPSPTPPTGMDFPCPVCGMSFPDAAALTVHLDSGFQPRDGGAAAAATLDGNAPSWACPCGRAFSEERALAQHSNHCSGKGGIVV